MNEEQKTSVPKAPEIAFLRTELLTGLTLSRIALSTNHTEKRSRKRANAKKAYDTVIRFLPGTNLAPDQEVELKSMLEELKWELQLLGEAIYKATYK